MVCKWSIFPTKSDLGTRWIAYRGKKRVSIWPFYEDTKGDWRPAKDGLQFDVKHAEAAAGAIPHAANSLIE